MPLSLRRGAVTAISERHEGLVRAEVDGAPCVAYPRLTGPVALGDEVLVNTQARDLALGSGGFDVLYANLTRGLGLAAEDGAHVMKLPYTPGQVAARHAEEDGELAESLDGMPVVCCSLHSQVAPVCAALAGLASGLCPDRGRRAAGVALRRGARPEGARAARRRDRGGRMSRRGRAVRDRPVGAPLGEGAGVRRRRLRNRPGDRRDRDATSATAESQLPRRPMLPSRSAAGPWSPAVSRNADERDRHRGVSHHTRGRARAVPRRSRDRRRRRGLARGVRRAAALAHGPRARRGSGVLRRRLRGRQARAENSLG